MLRDFFKKPFITSFFNICFLVSIISVLSISVYLRYCVFNTDFSFFIDENTVCLILLRSYADQLFVANQPVAPLFLIVHKLIHSLFGFNDSIFRIPVFICSVMNIFLFAYLTCIVLKNRLGILIANILFGLSIPVIMYSWIIKPYQSDVFFTIFILLLAFLLKDHIFKYGEIILLALLSFFCVLYSFSSVFILGSSLLAMLIYRYQKKMYNKNSLKKLLCYILPVCSACAYYFYIYCLPVMEYQSYDKSWWEPYFFPSSLPEVKNLLTYFINGHYTEVSYSFTVIICLVISTILLLIKENRQKAHLVKLIIEN